MGKMTKQILAAGIVALGFGAQAKAFQIKLPPLPIPPKITGIQVQNDTQITTVLLTAHGQAQRTLDIKSGAVTHFCDETIAVNPPLVVKAELFYAFGATDATQTQWTALPMDIEELPQDPAGCQHPPQKSQFKAVIPFASLIPGEGDLRLYVKVTDTSNNVAFTSPGAGEIIRIDDPVGDAVGKNADTPAPLQSDIQGVSIASSQGTLEATLHLGGSPKSDGGHIEGFLGLLWNGDAPFPEPTSTDIPKGAYAVTTAFQSILPDLVHVIWDGSCLTKAAKSGSIAGLLDCQVATPDQSRFLSEVTVPNTIKWTIQESDRVKFIGADGLVQMAFATGQIDIAAPSGSSPFWINDMTGGISYYAKPYKVEPAPPVDPPQEPTDPPIIVFPPNDKLLALCAHPMGSRLSALEEVLGISLAQLPGDLNPDRFEEKVENLCQQAQLPSTCEEQRGVVQQAGMKPEDFSFPSCGMPACERRLLELKDKFAAQDCAVNADVCQHLSQIMEQVSSQCANGGDPSVPPNGDPKPEPGNDPRPPISPEGICSEIVKNLLPQSKPLCEEGNCPEPAFQPDQVLDLCTALNIPGGVIVPSTGEPGELPNITIDFCKDKPNCVSLSLDLVDAAKNDGSVMPQVRYDIVDARDPSKSCLLPSLERKASGATLNVRLPLQIDPTRCSADTPVNIRLNDVPKGYSRNGEDASFDCMKNIRAENLTSEKLADCKLATPETGGDANRDGKVDLMDFGRVKQLFKTNDAMADFDKDGDVDLVDFGIMKRYFGVKF